MWYWITYSDITPAMAIMPRVLLEAIFAACSLGKIWSSLTVVHPCYTVQFSRQPLYIRYWIFCFRIQITSEKMLCHLIVTLFYMSIFPICMSYLCDIRKFFIPFHLENTTSKHILHVEFLVLTYHSKDIFLQILGKSCVRCQSGPLEGYSTHFYKKVMPHFPQKLLEIRS